MGILRLASSETKRIDLGDGEYIDLLTDLSKKDFNGLLKMLPADYDTTKGFNAGQADDFMTALFVTLVRGWSLDVPASQENYLALSRNASNVVDEKLIEHFNSLQPTQAETKSSKGTGK